MSTNKVAVKAKAYLASSTLIVAFLIIVAGSLEQLTELNMIPEEYKGAVVAIIGALQVILRIRTTLPLSNRPLKSQAKEVPIPPPGAMLSG